MSTIMFLVYYFLFIGFFIGLGLFLIPWSTHLTMSNGVKSKPKGWGDFKKFKKHYEKVGVEKWLAETYKDSLFVDYGIVGEYDFEFYENNKIHASTFIFNGNVMKIKNPFSFLLIQRFIKKEVKRKKIEQGLINPKKNVEF